ncbi:hypothetical protein H0H87_005263, partial [Tephrocybe sp. NHM501043]
VEDVGKAHPRLVEVVETMVKKGKWTVPGTHTHFDLQILSSQSFHRLQGEVR